MRRIILISILVFFAFLVPFREIAFAEGRIAWKPEGVPICTADYDQQNIRMAPDGSGGAIIVWEDYRSGVADIYAQKINENGVQQWSTDGVAVCTATLSQLNPVIVSDGSGGAIIAWEDYRSGSYSDIYALRISSDTGGTYSGWTDDGVPLSTTGENKSKPAIVSDSYGGAIITWSEGDGSYGAICVGKISSSGGLLWNVFASSGTYKKDSPKIINDGTEYVIITWQDMRNGGHYDIYAQKMELTTVTTLWASNGNAVSEANGNQLEPQIVPDGSGGAIITWTDDRNKNPDIYAQRIDFSGQRVWRVGVGDYNGIPICVADREQTNPVIMNDLLDGTTIGAIIAWEDKRNGDTDIYAVKVGTDNPSINPGDEKLMAGGMGDQVSPRMVSDNRGGGIIAWIEKDSILTDSYKIFASKRNQNGDPVWINPQVQVCQASNIIEHQMVSDNFGGVIIAWVGGPSSDSNIYAQRIVETINVPPASISGIVLKFTDFMAIISGETEIIKGITGVEVEALTVKDNKLVSSDITFNGYYELTGLQSGTSYEVRATWSANDIVTSVSIESKAPNGMLCFILEVDYYLATILGNVSGVEREAKRVSGAGFKNSLSPGNGIAFVELEQRGKVIVRVPVETDGSYTIPNLLPGRFIARAYNGSIYSEPRTVNLKEGETLRVDFTFGIMPEETVFNYPNPAKDGSTTIRYYCGYTDHEAEIKIYNINGELVREVKDSEIDKTRASENIYSFLWDCKNSSGKGVASGVYIYIVEVKEKSSGETKKVVKRMAIIG